MKLYKEFKSRETFSKVVSIEEIYHELYCQYKPAGPESIIDYLLELSPHNSDVVNLFYEEDKQTKIVIEPIVQGVETLFSEFNSSSIALTGLDIIIRQGVCIQGDYKPRKYSYYTKERLKDILFRYGLKSFSKPFDFSIHDQDPDYQTEDYVKAISNLYNNYEITKSINLPNRNHPKLLLPNSLLFEKVLTSSYSDNRIKFSIISNDYGYRHLNRIKISAPCEKKCMNAFMQIEESIAHLVKDIYVKNYDLGGIDVFIHESNIEFASNKIDLTMAFYWFLKGLLLRNNLVDSI